MFKKKLYQVSGLLVTNDFKHKRQTVAVSARTEAGAKKKAKAEFEGKGRFIINKPVVEINYLNK